MIKCLFEIFSEIKKIDDNFCLDKFLKEYLSKKFDESSNKQFINKINQLKLDIKPKFLYYINILNDDNKGKEIIIDCIQKDYIEIYNKLIYDKVNNFIKLSLEKFRKSIKEQIEILFNSICEDILSDKNINDILKNIIIMINESEFLEDVNMNLINNKEKFWKDEYEKNKIILNYFKETKINILNNLKENFLSKINKIFQELLKKKLVWSHYLKDLLIKIRKEINKLYIEMLNKCNYQEDIEINIKKYDNLLTEIFPIFREKYFKTISEKRINEIKDYISDICKEEYLKIIKNKLPIWKNIKNEIHLRIKENIDSYLKNIFNQKQFKDEIDPNKGKRDYFFKIIPSDIINPSNFKDKERQKEIYDLIENEINNGIMIFNKNRDKLPLLNETINLKINTCSKLIDEHIEEVINQFSYLEEKFNLNSDYFFTLITKNQEIYKNCNNKIKEINLKLRELCIQKSKEYDSLVQKIKPSWNKIISEKISIIQNICLNFINNTFNNKYFQNDIKIDIDNLKQSIFSYSNLYKDIKDHKKKELDLLIEKEIQKTLEKIKFKKNSMENWNVVQNQLIQKAIIEMSNKAKNNLNTVDFNTVVNILCNHIEKIPGFFDYCKINEKKILLGI